MNQVPVFILKEEKETMPRGRKPGSKNAKTVQSELYCMSVEGTSVVNIVPDPINFAKETLANGTPLGHITAQKMSKKYTLEMKMVPEKEAKAYALPEIMVLQTADIVNNKPEVRGNLPTILSKLDTNREFFGLSDDIFNFVISLQEKTSEKSVKKHRGRPRKIQDTPVLTSTSDSIK
jgi:hypothetical protein